MFEECLQKYLNHKTRILATHQLQYIKAADSIIVLDQGKIQQFANYHDLLTAHPEYSSLVAEDKAKDTSDDSSVEKSTSLRRRFSHSSIKVSFFFK